MFFTPSLFSVRTISTENKHGATADWLRVCQINICDPRLDELERLMENKAIRNEPEALRFNAAAYLSTIDDTVENVLYDIIYKRKEKLKDAIVAAGGAVFLATVLQIWPIAVMVILLFVLLALHWWSTKHCMALENFIYARQLDFDERLDQLCSSWLTINE